MQAEKAGASRVFTSHPRQLICQGFEAPLDQIEDPLKPVITAIIGVWNIAARQELMQRRGGVSRLDLLQIRKVAAIHCENMIEVMKIFRDRLSGAQSGQIYAAAGGRFDHAVIWRRTDMPGTCPGTVDLPVQSLPCGEGTCEAIRRWRTANVSEADEKQARQRELGVGEFRG